MNVESKLFISSFTKRWAIRIAGGLILIGSIIGMNNNVFFNNDFGNGKGKLFQIIYAKNACNIELDYPEPAKFNHITLYDKDETLPDRISMIGTLEHKGVDFEVYCLYDTVHNMLLDIEITPLPLIK